MSKIRLARTTDIPAILDLELACFQPHRRASPASLRRSIASPHQSVWVVDAPDGLAALLVLWHRRHTVRVYDIATHPAHRGKGIAGALMAHAEARARRDGATRIVLEADPKEPGLVPWYEKRGYTVTARLPDYYGPRKRAVRMEKRVA